jgi:hypothetical protein
MYTFFKAINKQKSERVRTRRQRERREREGNKLDRPREKSSQTKCTLSRYLYALILNPSSLRGI